jgi:shikimate kinase
VPASEPRHIVLVGMMGSGKTTVGRLLAERLHRPFFDSDELVEAATGRTVREIWLAEGEAAYRVLEEEALRDALASPDPAVIAAAGGVVLSAANRAVLTSSGDRVVWLRADPAVLVDRVRPTAVGGHRPLLGDDPDAAIRRLDAVRAPLYREVAGEIVEVGGHPPDAIVDGLLA